MLAVQLSATRGAALNRYALSSPANAILVRTYASDSEGSSGKVSRLKFTKKMSQAEPASRWLCSTDPERGGRQYRNVVKGRTNYITGHATQPFPLNPTFKPPPPLSDAFRSQIYKEYMENPAINTPVRLGARHKLSVARVEAVLKLKMLEQKMSQNGIPLQHNFTKGMEEMMPSRLPYGGRAYVNKNQTATTAAATTATTATTATADGEATGSEEAGNAAAADAAPAETTSNARRVPFVPPEPLHNIKTVVGDPLFQVVEEEDSLTAHDAAVTLERQDFARIVERIKERGTRKFLFDGADNFLRKDNPIVAEALLPKPKKKSAEDAAEEVTDEAAAASAEDPSKARKNAALEKISELVPAAQTRISKMIPAAESAPSATKAVIVEYSGSESVYGPNPRLRVDVIDHGRNADAYNGDGKTQFVFVDTSSAVPGQEEQHPLRRAVVRETDGTLREIVVRRKQFSKASSPAAGAALMRKRKPFRQQRESSKQSAKVPVEQLQSATSQSAESTL